jgi:hypothetical protein
MCFWGISLFSVKSAVQLSTRSISTISPMAHLQQQRLEAGKLVTQITANDESDVNWVLQNTRKPRYGEAVKKRLTLNLMNANIKSINYAFCGSLDIRAGEIEMEMKKVR